MIEPHSAQLGASSWILNATFALPRESVTVPPPFPLTFGAAAAWPFVAMTANASLVGAAPTPGVPAATTGEPAVPDGASSFKAVAVGASGAVDPRSAVGGAT